MFFALGEGARARRIPSEFHSRFIEHLCQTLRSESFELQAAIAWDAAGLQSHPAIDEALVRAFEHASSFTTASDATDDYIDYAEEPLVRYVRAS